MNTPIAYRPFPHHRPPLLLNLRRRLIPAGQSSLARLDTLEDTYLTLS